jgi:hypothetical protein
MGAVNGIISAARYKIVDTLSKNFTDTELLVYVNEGNRLLRKTVALLNPNLVITKETKNTTASQDYVTTAKTILHLPDGCVRIDGDPIYLINPEDIHDLSETGQPKYYWQEGFTTVTLWPVPDKVYSVSIRYVESATALIAGGNTIWPAEYDDIIQEYMVIRAGTRDGAITDVEQQFLKWFIDQITPFVCLATPAGGAESYW